MAIAKIDPEINNLILQENARVRDQVLLIASENYVSKAVLEAIGTVTMNKYSEGEVGKRYYQGNQNIDGIERLAKERALKLFKLDPEVWDVEVQAVTGAYANAAIYSALIEPGDRMLGMYLKDGGHLSHGWKVSQEKKTTFVSKIYDSHFYHVEPETNVFDYDQILERAKEVKPAILISGGTAYPREIDHQKMGEIAKEVGAIYHADVSHEAGLIAGGVNSSPFEHSDVVMMTTRKTLRGPNGALIFSRRDISEKIKKAVFPGMQGGPLNDHIAGIAVALKEALNPEFKEYSQQVIKNAKRLAKGLIENGFNIVTDGTDKHLLLVDLRDKGVTGKVYAQALEKANIISNFNTVPNDTASPFNPSGLRLGTPCVTSRGMKEGDVDVIVDFMVEVLDNIDDQVRLEEIGVRVKEFANKFFVPGLDD